MTRPTAITALIVTFALLLCAPSAFARGSESRANFTATISGTYDVSGTVTNTKCFRENANGDTETFTATGQTSEHTTFRTTKGKLLAVSRTRGDKRFFAGGDALPVAATITRTGTNPGSSEPSGCRPNPPPNDCGTKNRKYHLSPYGVGRGFGFSYNFTENFSTEIPEDPFNDCALPEKATWWGQYYSRGNGVARVSPRKIFNRHVKKIVLHGGLTRSPKATTSDYTASATEKLSWTLTLKRRR
jgi:hypothetical protein